MLKTRELVGIIEDALIEMDDCVSKQIGFMFRK